MSESNHGAIRVVIFAMAIMAGICITTLSICLLYGKVIDNGTATAYVGITQTLIGYLAGSLSKTTPTSTGPVEAKISNSKEDPVNTTEV